MNLRYYRAGAWLWIITGLGHTAGDLASRLRDDDPADAALRAMPFEMLGTRIDYHSLIMHFSLAMGVAIALAGTLFLFIARLAADDPRRARVAGFTGLAVSAGLLAFTVTVLRLPPPIITLSLATVAFAAALVAGSRGRVSTA